MSSNLSVQDLAIFGGQPRFSEPLHVGRPNIGDRERLMARIEEALDRRWLTNNGPLLQEFETKMAAFLGVKHFIAMCNGTIALEIAIRALELKGEVIVPSFTFIATAHALQWQEITPVFCDVDPNTHCMDPDVVERLITPRTTGIIGVHVWGRPCAISQLAEISQRRGLELMYDASHAFGSSYRQRMLGNFGRLEIFSFHATKFVNTLEGGAIATNDDALAKKIRLMKNFGFSGIDNVIYIGTNGKMNELSAAMGITSLEAVDSFVAANRENYEQYRQLLSDVPGLRIVEYDEREKNNYQYVVVEVDEERAGISRDELVSALNAENVLARKYFYPGCHNMEPYRSYFPHSHLLLPKTETLCSRVMVLPTGTSIGSAEISGICEIVRTCVGQSVDFRRIAAGQQESFQSVGL